MDLQQKKTTNQCSMHHSEYIAVDFNPQSEKEARFLCLKCLLSTTHEKNNIKSFDEANNYLSDIKGVFIQRKQEQSSKNLEILKVLISSIQSLKIFYNSFLDKIIDNLKQQEVQILEGEQELIAQLQKVDLNNYFQSNYQLIQIQYDQMKGIIETQIQNLKSQDKIDKCLQQVSAMDDSIITLAPESQSSNKIYKKQISRTPYLQLTCQTHQREIIYFDLNDQNNQETTIGCILCASNKLGRITDLLSAQKQWWDIENQKQSLLQSQLDNVRSRIETAQSQLKGLLNKFELKINEVDGKLSNSFKQILDKNQKELNKMNRDWLTLSREEILLIAHTLSRPQDQDNFHKKCEDDFNQDNEGLNNLIDDSFQYLIDAFKKCNEIISFKTYQRTQNDFNKRQIQLVIQSNIFTIDQQKKQNLTQHVAIQDQITTIQEFHKCISESYFGGESKTVMLQILQNELYQQIHNLSLEVSAQMSFSKQEESYQQLEKEKQQEQVIIQQATLKQIIDLTKQIEELKNQISNYQVIIQQLNEQIKKFEQEKQFLSTQNKNIQEQLNKQIDLLKEELKKSSQIIDYKDEILQSQTQQIDQNNQMIKQLETQRQQSSQNSKNQIDSLNQSIKQHIQENQKQKEQLHQQSNVIKEQNLLISKQSSEFDCKLKLLQQQKDNEIAKNKKLIEENYLYNEKNQEDQQKQQTIIQQQKNQNIQRTKQNQEQFRHRQFQRKEQKKQFKEQQNQNNEIKMFSYQNIADQGEQIMKQQQEINVNQLQTQLQQKNFQIDNMKRDIQDITKKLEEKQFIINQLKLKEFQYEIKLGIHRPLELVYVDTYKQSDWCQAIAFNKEQTIMVAGCGDNKISVFEFEQGRLYYKQLLRNHTSNLNICTLQFINKLNQFISGTNREIGIWSYNNTNQQWYCLQLLKQAHSSYINRVIMNKNEDLFISCSDDKTIKFWIKKNEWECSQTLTNHTYYVYSICLNESCTQLVSCGGDKQILISQQGGDQKWTVIQSIQVDEEGYRLYFIDDNVIVFQPFHGIIMQTYQLDQQRRQFIKSKDLTVQNDSQCSPYFPMQFNNNQQLLFNKHGEQIHLIRKQNNDFIIELSINFNTQYIFGAMTDDFQYLVTWDYKSKEFQVRKQK